MAYLLRPNAETASFIKAQAALVFPRGLPSSYFSVFVRRTDKVQEAPIYELGAYAAALEPLQAAAPSVRDIYFNSDDPEALLNVTSAFPGLRVWHMTMDRGFSLAKLATFSAAQVGAQMRLSLTDLFLEAHADAHVGTLSSNWLRLVDELRLAAGKTAFAFADVDGKNYAEYRLL